MPERKPKEPKPDEILRSGGSLPDHYLPQHTNSNFPILSNPISPIKRPNFEQMRPFELPKQIWPNDKSSIGGSLPPADTRHNYKR